MADPLIVRVLTDYRAQLEAAESAQFRDLAARWLAVQDRLELTIDALAEETYALRQAGETISRGRLLRMERYQALLGQFEAETLRFDAIAAGRITNGQMEYGGLGLDAATEAIRAGYMQAGEIPAEFNRIPRAALVSAAGIASDGSPLTLLLAQSYPLAVRQLTDAIIQGVALGWNPRKTARAMRDAADVPLNRALRIARTEQMRAYREATRRQYVESGVVRAYRRLAAKSMRTCPACLFSDGRIYQLDEPLDEHVSGLCQLVSVLIDVPERRWQTGREWFETLPAARQAEILGPGAYAEWQRRQFDLGKFVTVKKDATWGNSLQVTPLRQLAR